MNSNKMPPGRDNIPLDHPRRIARIAYLPARQLALEPKKVRDACEEYRRAREAVIREEQDAGW